MDLVDEQHQPLPDCSPLLRPAIVRPSVERRTAHLLAHRDERRVGERAALPVGAVDHERVTGDEPRVRRGEERRGPSELMDLPTRSAGWRSSTVLARSRFAADVGCHVLVGEQSGHQGVHLDPVRAPIRPRASR